MMEKNTGWLSSKIYDFPLLFLSTLFAMLSPIPVYYFFSLPHSFHFQAALYLSCVQIIDTLDSRQSYININT